MKKIICLFAICFFSQGVFSQTSVFELNQEKARYNQSRNISQIIAHSFQSKTPISNSDFIQICAIMEQKDGYVSCRLNTQNKLIVEYENWIPINDIIDVIGQFVPVELDLQSEHLSK